MLSGMLMQVREEHQENADFPMLVTLSGILMLVGEERQENASLQITLVPSFII